MRGRRRRRVTSSRTRSAEAHEAQDADRVVGERRRSAGAEPTRREIAQASRGIQHRGRPLAQGGDPHGQRIHRHVAPGQVRLERRPAEVGEVDDGPGRAGEDDPCDAVSGADGNEGAAQTVGQPAGHVPTSPRQHEVEVVDGPTEERVADDASREPDRAIRCLLHGGEERP